MAETNQGAKRKDKPFVQKSNDALGNAGVRAWVHWEGIELACSQLISNLSINAWTFFFDDEDYRAICPNLSEPELLGQTAQ